MGNQSAGLAFMLLSKWRGEVNRILHLMRIGDCEELTGMPALDAHGVARDLRELADRIEAKAKDYSRKDAA